MTEIETRPFTEARIRFYNFDHFDLGRVSCGIVSQRNEEDQERGERAVLHEFMKELRKKADEIEEVLDDGNA